MLKNKKIIIFGCGNRGRDLLEVLPRNMVSYFCDNDKSRWGGELEGVEIISFEQLKCIWQEYDIIISAHENRDIIMQLETAGISYWKSSGITEENYFLRNEVITYIDNNLYEKYLYDKRCKNEIVYENKKNWYRTEYSSDRNKKIVERLKENKIIEVENENNELYRTNPIYEDEFFVNRPGMRLIRTIIKKFGEKLKICDFACGYGELLVELKKEGHEVWGVDMSPERVNEVRKKGINAVCSNTENMPFTDNSFDVVTCLECLEHVHNPIDIVTRISKMLKDEGIVYCTVPYGHNCECDFHVRQFDERSLVSLFLNEFEIINILRIPYINGDGNNSIFIAAKKVKSFYKV